jgi:hypothetical protein
MSPDKSDIGNTIAMRVQEKDSLKASNGGSIDYVKDNKKRNFTQSNQSSPSKPHGKAPFYHQHQQRQFSVDKDTCLHYKKPGHYKKYCPD